MALNVKVSEIKKSSMKKDLEIVVLQQEISQMRHMEAITRNQKHMQTEIVKQRK